MTATTIAGLLHAALLLLSGVKSAGNAVAPAAAQKAVYFAGNAVQLAAQAEAPVGFAVAQNDGVWPNMKDLTDAPYRNASGKWVRIGDGVQLIEGGTSFGDLNHDGRDDAAVIVEKAMPGGAQEHFLAAMLDQGGIMFDVAETPLGGASFAVLSHGISGGVATINGSRYELVGNRLFPI